MATDFFDQQDAARRRTSLLIGYFLLAVLAIVVAVYSVVSAVWMFESRSPHGAPAGRFLDGRRAAVVVPAVLLVIVAGTTYKVASLRRGGSAIADLLGGRLVNPGTTDLAERRLLNVVEEMALASGTPVPSVYVLDDEPGINAFAAGFAPGDAVIGISRGSLDHLTRDELQGVIAHEFSHLLNGDMRLNLRLIGLLHGILLLALIGQLMIRIVGNSSTTSRRRSSNGDNKDGVGLALLLLGVGLVAIGFIGLFFGRLIKCAISRQREFLADSSAVQFTRNPGGIAGALKKIGGLKAGSKIVSPNAEQACHMFFGAGVPAWLDLLATHPPLAVRIRRLDPSFDGSFPQIAASEHVLAGSGGAFDDADPRALIAGFDSTAPAGPQPADFPLDSGAAVESVGAPREEHFAYAHALLASLPAPLVAAAREPFSARAVIYALLLDPTAEVRKVQLELLDRDTEPGTVVAVLKLVPMVDALGAEARLPLADLTLPALRQLSPAQYRTFRGRIGPLVMADRQVSLFEFALQRMLLRHLDRHFEKSPPRPVRYQEAGALRDEIAVLLSALADVGNDDPRPASDAFDAGVRALRPTRGTLSRKPAAACSLRDVDRSLTRIGAATPAIKRRVLDACAACIAADGRVTAAEGELLRAIADALDCPMPPLLAG